MSLLLAWRLDISAFIDGIELSALDRVGQDLGGLLNTFEKAVVFGVTGGSLLVGMVAKDLLAVGTLYLVFCSAVAVFGEAENGVVILSLNWEVALRLKLYGRDRVDSHLPVFGIALEHQWVFWFANLARITVFHFLHIFLCLYPLIFRECAVVSLLQW